MKENNMKLNRRIYAFIIVAAVIVAAGVIIKQENYFNKQTDATSAITPSPTPITTEQTNAITVVKAAYAEYDNGRGTQTYTAINRLRDSKYVTIKLAKYLDDIDRGFIEVPIDPLLCAQNISDNERIYIVGEATNTSANIISRQKHSDNGTGGLSMTSIDLIKDGESWKLDTLKCVPQTAE